MKLKQVFNHHKHEEEQQIEIIKNSEFFDTKWYLEKNPDVKSRKMSAARHYLKNGWKENRNPSPKFSTREYLKKYPECKICPLVFEYNRNSFVDLAICAIMKNEGPYVKEWIDYHRLVGVKRFYIYDNESTDNMKEVLTPYIEQGVVVYTYFPGENMQMAAYNDNCLKKYKNKMQWLAFIDADEFIVPKKKNTLPEILKDYEKYPALGINWVNFDSNGHENKPTGGVLENYIRTYYNLNLQTPHRIKSIIQPKMCKKMRSAHDADFYDNQYAVTENKEPITKKFAQVGGHLSFTNSASVNKIQINHYYSKSAEEYRAKIDKGLVKFMGNKKKKNYNIKQIKYTDYKYDYSAYKYVIALKPELKLRETIRYFWLKLKNLGLTLYHPFNKNSVYCYFDKKWYLKQYPDAQKSSLSAIDHYNMIGWAKGYNPSPNFNTNEYLKEHPDITKLGFNPLCHFLSYSGKLPKSAKKISKLNASLKSYKKIQKKLLLKMRKKGKTYIKNLKKYIIKKKSFKVITERELLESSGYFDSKWYLKSYPKVAQAKMDPIEHYMKYGWKEGRNPSEKFDTKFYLETYKEVKEKGLNPLLHFVKHGKKEGKLPLPKKDNIIEKLLKKSTISSKKHSENYELIAHSKYFSKKYYLKNYPDVKDAGVDPIEHYMKYGWKEGRNPSEKFDTKFYLETYEGVKEKGYNPLLHFIKYGKKEGKLPLPPYRDNIISKLLNKNSSTTKHSGNYELIAHSKYFSRKYYLEQNPDVKDAGIDPIEHYLKRGWKEGRNPSEKFNTKFYMDLYEDVRKSDKCPLIHYLKYGQKENRKTSLELKKDLYGVSALLRGEQFKKRNLDYLKGNDVKLKICYISFSSRSINIIKDPSVRYRCYNPAEALSDETSMVAVCHLSTFLKYPSYNYDIYVFHRPTMKLDNFKHIFKNLQKLHKIVIADYDDLIFGNDKDIELSTIKLCQGRNDAETSYNFKCFTKALKLFDNISVSTPALKEAVLKIKPEANVQIIHNFIPERLLSLAEDLRWREKEKNKNLVMYCCGGQSHNADFEMIKQALLNCLEKDKNLQLRILGRLDLPEEFNDNPRCEVLKSVDYLDMFEVMSDAAITIAPLTNTFNNLCKSNIKFLESSLVGNLLLTSSCSLTAEDNTPKTLIGVAQNVEDWERLILNREELLSKKYIKKNLTYVEKKYTKHNFLNEWSSLLHNYKGE